jgi:spore coat protein M
MNKKENSKPPRINGVEDWMEQFLEDPFTSMMDHFQFRVDLFETSHEYIVEAELINYKKEHLSVEINGASVIIQAKRPTPSSPENDKVERIVTLPFTLAQKDVQARYTNNILEINIKKEGQIRGKNSTILIH